MFPLSNEDIPVSNSWSPSPKKLFISLFLFQNKLFELFRTPNIVGRILNKFKEDNITTPPQLEDDDCALLTNICC